MSIRSDEPETGSRGPITARSMARSMAATADALTRDAPDREAAFAYLVTAVRELAQAVDLLCDEESAVVVGEPIAMLLWCPECGQRHVDEGMFATKAHHTHACQWCGHVWRPAIVATVGVMFLPGFKNEPSP